MKVTFLRIRANAVLSRNRVRGTATGNKLIFVVQWKCAQNLGTGGKNSLRRRLIFAGTKVGIRFVSFSEMGPGFLENL